MQDLQTLIELLTYNRKLHISILDLSGILDTPLTKLRFENVIHSKTFCRIAKSTPSGKRACLRCKAIANAKAVGEKEEFYGYCIYGLYEYALPIVIGNSAAAIIYVGNAIIDEGRTRDRLERTVARTKVNADTLCEQLKNCEKIESVEDLKKVAETVRDHLLYLFENTPLMPKSEHWLIRAMKRYAKNTFPDTATLTELSKIYRKNEKYIGRLFLKTEGISFARYCINLKLSKAEELLDENDMPILDIALECGFNNISYFNRIFKEKHKISPKEYRKNR